MTRERWEQILFAHVSDEVVQDMLNQYVLELESSNDKLRKLVQYIYDEGYGDDWFAEQAEALGFEPNF